MASSCRRSRRDTFDLKWVLLLFYPLDLTSGCPTEMLAFSADAEAFRPCNCEILGTSVESKHTHRAWVMAGQENGGLSGTQNDPLLADLMRHLARD